MEPMILIPNQITQAPDENPARVACYIDGLIPQSGGRVGARLYVSDAMALAADLARFELTNTPGLTPRQAQAQLKRIRKAMGYTYS